MGGSLYFFINGTHYTGRTTLCSQANNYRFQFIFLIFSSFLWCIKVKENDLVYSFIHLFSSTVNFNRK